MLIPMIVDSETYTLSVIRLGTSIWSDNRGLHCKRSLQWMKRLSTGFHLLQEELNCMGANEVFERIVNVDSCPDGLYVISPCHEHHDYESGLIDDNDYQLIPFTVESS